MSSSRVALRLAGALILAVGLLGGCTSNSGMPDGGTQEIVYEELPGDVGNWKITSDQDISTETTSFIIDVWRLACSNGETGEILDPIVDMQEEQIVIYARVAALPDGAYNCPGNDLVPATITLEQPIGERPLVDGECLQGEASTTAFCLESVRWNPKSGIADPVF